MPTRARARESRTIEQAVTTFWLQVDRGSDDACWPWLGYTEDGYGRFYFAGRMRFAHDLSLEWWGGEARTAGLETCHSCNNRICVNPHHLRYDTRLGNVADMMTAGTHGALKLSDEQVRLIRVRHAAGAEGKDLAADVGVSPALVSGTINGSKRAAAGGPIRTSHGNSRTRRFSQ